MLFLFLDKICTLHDNQHIAYYNLYSIETSEILSFFTCVAFCIMNDNESVFHRHNINQRIRDSADASEDNQSPTKAESAKYVSVIHQ